MTKSLVRQRICYLKYDYIKNSSSAYVINVICFIGHS